MSRMGDTICVNLLGLSPSLFLYYKFKQTNIHTWNGYYGIAKMTTLALLFCWCTGK